MTSDIAEGSGIAGGLSSLSLDDSRYVVTMCRIKDSFYFPFSYSVGEPLGTDVVSRSYASSGRSAKRINAAGASKKGVLPNSGVAM